MCYGDDVSENVSVRLEDGLAQRLRLRARAAGETLSDRLRRYAEEGVRRDEHPLVTFRTDRLAAELGWWADLTSGRSSCGWRTYRASGIHWPCSRRSRPSPGGRSMLRCATELPTLTRLTPASNCIGERRRRRRTVEASARRDVPAGPRRGVTGRWHRRGHRGRTGTGRPV